MVNALDLDPFTRSLWGEFDAYAIAQLDRLSADPCFKPKVYVAPDVTANLIPALQYAQYGMQISAGAIIFGTLATMNGAIISTPSSYLVQITDVCLKKAWYSAPVPALFLSNRKNFMPNFLTAPYPVVGSGLFNVEFWNQQTATALIQLLIFALEPCAQ
jgi:hypothetical protein